MKFSVIDKTLGLLALSFLVCACGGSSGSGIGGDSLSNVGLSDLPAVSTMVGTSDSATALRRALSGRALVTGDEFLPLLTELPDDPDQYFWNGLIAEIIDVGYNPAGNPDGDAFWDGRGACWMVQSFGQSFKNVLQGGSSLCYMKNIPLVSEVTIVGSSAANLFTPTAADKRIKINIENMTDGDGPPSSQTMNMRVIGTNSIGTNKLEYRMWSCESVDADAPGDLETITVDLDTGEFVSTSIQNKDENAGTFSLSGFLSQDADGSIAWNLNRAREATVHYAFAHEGGGGSNEGIFKSTITIDGDQLSSKMYESMVNSWNDGAPQTSNNLNKRFLTSIFEGSSLTDLKLRQVASVESTSQTGGPWGDAEFTHKTAKDWNATNASDGHYETQLSGVLFDIVDIFDFGADDFYAGTLVEPDVTISVEDYPCDGEADVTVVMDFALPALQAIQDLCDVPWGNYDMCWGGEVSEAERVIFQEQLNP